ncbi:Hypothetical_protein [Hexamita inflata]|uniref:Hypothetical_protein n=1 Tax=Hexamita inflata TaxID=28002 RepID=A0AA86RJ78_9EUKA|nr:Hypothetical protein HINF_LOCUS63463 [Hexamita inflata]
MSSHIKPTQIFNKFTRLKCKIKCTGDEPDGILYSQSWNQTKARSLVEIPRSYGNKSLKISSLSVKIAQCNAVQPKYDPDYIRVSVKPAHTVTFCYKYLRFQDCAASNHEELGENAPHNPLF